MLFLLLKKLDDLSGLITGVAFVVGHNANAVAEEVG
jgi:hypothetical protein